MATLSSTYRDGTKTSSRMEPRARTGGPRSRPETATHAYVLGWTRASHTPGSHMPLDTDIHWDWRNPLNIIPALVLLVTAIALLSLLLS